MSIATVDPEPHNLKRQSLTAVVCALAAVASPVLLSMVVEGEISDHAARAAARIAGIVAVIAVAAYLLFWRVRRHRAAAMMLGILAPLAAALVLAIAFVPYYAVKDLLAMVIPAKPSEPPDIPDDRVTPEHLAVVEKCAIGVKLTAIHQVNQIKAFWGGGYYSAKKLKHGTGSDLEVIRHEITSREFTRTMAKEYVSCFYAAQPGENPYSYIVIIRDGAGRGMDRVSSPEAAQSETAWRAAVEDMFPRQDTAAAMLQMRLAALELHQQTSKALDLLRVHRPNVSIVDGKLFAPDATVNAELRMRLTRIDALRALEEAGATNLLTAIDRHLDEIRERAKPKARPSAT